MLEKQACLTSKEIRRRFVRYFVDADHHAAPPGPLVPFQDETLLFTNAGMNQFKDFFLGLAKPPHPYLVTVQPCLRAGGKHNDLEEVGKTKRHHTYFEMLGNFSFGSLSCARAVALAWNFLTDPQRGLGLDPGRLWVTVYEKDLEIMKTWEKMEGFAMERLVKIGDRSPDQPFESDNFWRMGDVGPCGPCTEIFYDLGEHIAGTPPGINQEGERYVEIWNLVFMTYKQGADGSLIPLPQQAIDTGMGLERISAVVQGLDDNYQNDVFHALIASLAEVTKVSPPPCQLTPYRILADHMRAIVYLFDAGVKPGPNGRGYILRRLIRRSMLQAALLSQALAQTITLTRLMNGFFETLQGLSAQPLTLSCPELNQKLRDEEKMFEAVLLRGQKLFKEVMLQLPQDARLLPGEEVFKLYDTYGLPLDFISDLAKDSGRSLDMKGFEQAMALQKERGKATQAVLIEMPHLSTSSISFETAQKSERFEQGKSAKIVQLFNANGETVASLKAGVMGSVVVDVTPFEIEKGGVVGDVGWWCRGSKASFQIFNSRTPKGQAEILHEGRLCKGALSIGDEVSPYRSLTQRIAKAQHHTAVHLLQATLRTLLGSSIEQAGSWVDADRARFDFRFSRLLTAQELSDVTLKMNEAIQACHTVLCSTLSLEAAKAAGALAFFSDRYASEVKVYQMGPSFEVCGGPHAQNTGELGGFAILKISTIGEGVRRMEGCTGQAYTRHVLKIERELKTIAEQLGTSVEQTSQRFQQQHLQSKAMELRLKRREAWMVQKILEEGKKSWVELTLGFFWFVVLDEHFCSWEMAQQLVKASQQLGVSTLLLWQPEGIEDRSRLILAMSSKSDLVLKGWADWLKDRFQAKGGGKSLMAQMTINQAQGMEAWQASKAWLKEDETKSV